MPDQIFERVAGLLAEVTGTPAHELTEHSGPGTTPGWDSFANLAFIASVEESFGVRIPTTQVVALRSLGDMATFIRRKGT
jgi:acyl carrier protein